MIDFQNEVLKIKDQLIDDIKTLVAIPSVDDASTAGEMQPYGKACKDALDAMLVIGKRDGFEVENVDGHAGHIDIGEGDQVLGILGHLDVVPVNKEGWNSNPFEAIELDGRLYGRGVADDKGPLLAGYYAAKIIHNLGVSSNTKTRIIFGCNEEMGSNCVKYYFSKKPFPTFGFTPDANFPVVYGEKSTGGAEIKGQIEDDNLICLYAGTRSNIVPDECVAVIKGDYRTYEASYKQFLKDHHLTGTIEEEGNCSKLLLKGKSSHGSLPEQGINAIYYLSKYLNTIIHNDVIQFIVTYLSDYYGKAMNVDHVGEMGPLTINLGVIKYRKGSFTINLDLRCPHDIDFDHLKQTIESICHEYQFEVSQQYSKFLYIDPNSSLITSLHQAYVDVTGDHQRKPQAIGGGTYAKAMPNCVAFGPEFPNENNNIHENNESIAIDSLLKATEIYARAIYNLINEEIE